MAFANKVVTENYGVDKNILIAPELAMTVGVVVANTGIQADSDGKKIIKAGTPLYGDLTARNTAFVVATTTAATQSDPASNNAVCVCLHDVDVTSADNNATAVIDGSIDLLKLDSSVITLLDEYAIAALPNIHFLKGAK